MRLAALGAAGRWYRVARSDHRRRVAAGGRIPEPLLWPSLLWPSLWEGGRCEPPRRMPIKCLDMLCSLCLCRLAGAHVVITVHAVSFIHTYLPTYVIDERTLKSWNTGCLGDYRAQSTPSHLTLGPPNSCSFSLNYLHEGLERIYIPLLSHPHTVTIWVIG